MRFVFRFAVVIALGCAGVFAADPKPLSEFTTTNARKVKVLEDSEKEKNPEIDHFKYLCPGLGGYQVLFEGADSRSWIDLQIGGRTVDLMADTFAACPGQFPAKTNDVVEWRGFRKGGVFVPYAVIYRMTSQADDKQQTPVETFIIIKLDGKNSKVVAHVPAKEGNEKAEAVADRARKP